MQKVNELDKIMKISNEFKIGFWTIIAIVVLFFGIQYLKGINSIKLGTNYYISCDNVDGLMNSGPVRINGYKVGLIRSMEFNAVKGVIVEINISDKSVKIPTDSRAYISSDLLGSGAIVIELGNETTYLNSLDTIPGGEKMPGLLDSAQPIITDVQALMPKIDSLVAGINILVHETKMKESLLEINKLTYQLNTTVSTLNKYLKGEVPEILENVNSLTANVDTIASQVKDAHVEELIAKANMTLETTNELIKKISEGEGTASKLINSAELHDQLIEAISNVDSLLVDIKKNPKRYIHIKVF